RFLGFMTDCHKSFSPPKPVTEGRFTPWTSGCALVQGVTREEALYVAHQLFAACPAAWELEDGQAVVDASPSRVGRWVTLMRVATGSGVPLELLKTCADYVREGG